MATRIIQATPESLRRLRDLQRQVAAVKHGVSRYYHDPLAFAADCIDWRDLDGLTTYQTEIIGGLPSAKRMAVRGPHGLGKSAIAALTVLWFALTRDAAGTDWKIVTTAGAWRQLSAYLWPEIHKWSGRIRWDRVRDQPFTRAELLNLNLRLSHGAATAAACTNPALIEGAHADALLFIYDESKAIPASTFDACEGAFSGTGEALALALSTPGAPAGRFYDIHSRRPGYEDWAARHVTLAEAIAAGRIDHDWAEQRSLQWGDQSSIYVNRVLGEFHAGDEDSVIPLAWAEAAVERWHDWAAAGKRDGGWPRTVGVDVARSGEDRTVLAVRHGPVITELRVSSKEDTMQTTGRVMAVLAGHEEAITPVVDVIGIGSGVVDRLREQDVPVVAFNASEATKRKDITQELSYLNCRAGAWWNLREMLDPSGGPDVCLPDDEQLLSELSAPQWVITSGGKIQVESKDKVRERLGRSTDHADATIQAFWVTETGARPTARRWQTATELDQSMASRDPYRRRLVNGQQRQGADDWQVEGFAPMDGDEMPVAPHTRRWQ
jgi:hypothetical protein